MQKYGFDDARDVLERASARETAARVAAGAVAKAFLAELGIGIVSHVVQLGPVVTKSTTAADAWRTCRGVDESQVRCFDPETPRRPWWPRSRRPPRSATPSAAWSRSSATASRSASAATCTGTAGWKGCWPRP